jgi:hypothetical protein
MPNNARDHEERERQLRTMEEALLDGFTDAEVVDAATKRWGLARSTVYEDLKIVRQRWEERNAVGRAANLDQAIARRERLYGKSMKVANKEAVDEGTALSAIRTALTIEQDKSKLQGLYPDPRLTVCHQRPQSVQDLSDAELIAIITGGDHEPTDQELIAIAGGGGGDDEPDVVVVGTA